MPWSKTNLPSAAKRLKGHSADIFVAAANSALKEYGKGSEGRAIATGLSAVKKHKDKLKAAKKSEVSKSTLDNFLEGFKTLLEKAFGEVEDNDLVVEVTKSVDLEQRRAMFVALAPNEVDAHGDINTEAAVEKACISFNTMCNKANLFHRVMTQDAIIEQSYITPAAFTTDSGIEVKKGSWVQWWHFPEDNPNSELLWKMVKEGEIQGISVGATAIYEDIQENVND